MASNNVIDKELEGAASADASITPAPLSDAPVEVAPAAEIAADVQTDTPKRNKFADKKKRKLPKWIKITIPCVLVGALGFGAYYLITSLISKDADPTQTGIVSMGTLEQNVSGWGNIGAKKKEEYGAKTRGEVTEVFVKAGDTVHAGDLLFSVDPTELQAELDTARRDLDAARTRVNEAADAITNLTTTAPFNGKLIEAGDFKNGQEVAAGAKIGKLIDDSTLLLSAYFSYAYIDSIAPGMKANVSIPDNMTSVVGNVESVDRIKKVKDGAVLFRVNITINNPNTLAAGSPAAATILTNDGDIMPAESGTLRNNREQELTMKSGGKVTFTSIMDYGEYSAGQNLCTVSNTNLRPALETAQRSYEDAEKKVTDLEKDMNGGEVRAEIDGQVSAIVVSVGDKLTGAGTPLVTVSDTTSLVVDVSIDELDISKVQVGMPVTITSDDKDSEAIIGTLTSLAFEAKIDQNNGGVATFPAKIDIESNGKFLPGMNVNYKISTIIKESCLTVPSAGVIYTESGVAAYVKKIDGKAYENALTLAEGKVPEGFVAVPIEIGLSDDNKTEVISGLEEGDEVYVTALSEGEDMGIMEGGGMVISNVGVAMPFVRW